MSLSSQQRHDLMARGHRLKATITVAGELPSQSAVDHVRRTFSGRDLFKVRVNTEDRDTCDRVGAALAEAVPCELVQRIGRVLLLYRAPAVPQMDEATTGNE